jgi:hypothetical protein
MMYTTTIANFTMSELDTSLRKINLSPYLKKNCIVDYKLSPKFTSFSDLSLYTKHGGFY